MPTHTDELLVRTFVDLADSLVDNFDVVEFLTMLADRCVRVIDVAAAGLMLASAGGEAAGAGIVQRSNEGSRGLRGPVGRRPVCGLLPQR